HLRLACHFTSSLFVSTTSPPPGSPLFPYTTLFRSRCVPFRVHLRNARWSKNRTSVRAGGRGGARWRLSRRPVQRECRGPRDTRRSEEHTSELQSLRHLVCRLLLEKKKNVEHTCSVR